MSCPHCQSNTVRGRKQRTALGYRRFSCGSCRRRFNERTGTPFNELQYPTDVVPLAVLWRLQYKLSFRDVAELLLQRGYVVTHATVRVWELRFAPLVPSSCAHDGGVVSAPPGISTRPRKRSLAAGAISTARSTATVP